MLSIALLLGVGLIGQTIHGTSASTNQGFKPAAVKLGVTLAQRGFNEPLFLTFAPEGSKKVVVVEKSGTIKFLNGQVFLDIHQRVGSGGSEQGLLGLAFHPRYKTNGYFYVDYTDQNGNTVVSRFTARPGHQTADSGSEKVILRQNQPAANHNGGMLAFGPDKYLYIGLGDGGGGYDTYHNGQKPGTWLAKILRIDVDHGDPYAVPASNPFRRDSRFKPEVWDWGLRNPWRFSFDRSTGDLYIGDVGQDRHEEIDFERARTGGRNYGWSILEGSACLNGGTCVSQGLTPPVTTYDHNNGDCSVTGGYVYRGKRYARLRGAYLFADYCGGQIWSLSRNAKGKWVRKLQISTHLTISSFGQDGAGELYITDLGRGSVYHITARAR